LLAAAAGEVGSAEIRAIGTLGGNLHQRPRCWFFRSKDFDCIKKGGDICYAVKGDNRFNAIIGGHLCFIVHPSDLAVALLALDASAEVASAGGGRRVSFSEYFVGPGENLLQESVLQPDEVLTGVHVPPAAPGTRHAWEKLNDKGLPTWDFAVASAAVSIRVADGICQSSRIVLGGVAPVPYRATVVEEALAGREVNEAMAEASAAIRAVARPMPRNGYKVGLAEVVIERALTKALASAPVPAGPQ
jgi:xanthine dehydrogenase YagS FAD-binding subunit